MNLSVGDLVQGLRPWNRDALLGVVIAEGTEETHTFQVHWVNSGKSSFGSAMPVTWEVKDSLVRLNNEQ
tara:strand:- start:10100 stop:10306 length:207 start_codon:yes stop_codon:yes gene_type:complete